MARTTRPESILAPVARELGAEVDPAYAKDFAALADIIEQARIRAFQSVNRELIGVYWDVGARVSERVASQRWGRGVVRSFSEYIQRRFPGLEGFSTSNVWRMKQFYETYAGSPKLAPLAREISWSSNVLIMARAKTDEAREFYLLLAARYGYTKRELQRQIDAMLFERTMVSGAANRAVVERHPKLGALLDSYVLEFLDLPKHHREKDLRRAIVAHLREFFLEVGNGLSLVGEEYRLQVGNSDRFVDLLLYSRELECLVAIELKTGSYQPEYEGQLSFYLEALDRDVRKANENPSAGLILVADKDDTVVEYSLSRTLSPMMVAQYQLHLPDRAILEAKLRELRDVIEIEPTVYESDDLAEGGDGNA